MSEYTTTPNLGLFKPTVDADEEMWGVHLNLNADILDAAVSSAVRDYLATLPNSDAGLNVGDLFWNGGFLCKKV